MERFKVVKGSESAHCCFTATVVDTNKPTLVRGEPFIFNGQPIFDEVCECFELKDAETICKALNKLES